MSVVKMMTRIVDPKEVAAMKSVRSLDQKQMDAQLHKTTFGITSDPLSLFSCAFSALIHDLVRSK